MVLTPLADDELSLVDATFLHYRLQGTLGEGGTSRVYSAYSPSLDHHRAIKFLLPRFANDPEIRQRMLREARAIAAISHPNIVKVFECGELPRLYVTMELLRGEPLRDRLRREGPLKRRAMLDIASQMVAALLETSARGLVHRDLKPENFFLAQELGKPEVVKLIDFGLVKIPGENLTEAGALLGTPAYMSPEQCTGGPSVITASSDVYSLGLVFYEMLAGEPLYREKDPRKLLLLHQKSTPALHKLRNQPAALRALIGRMLRKAPDDRPSLLEIKQALEKLASRWRFAVVAGAAAAVFFALGSGTAAHFHHRAVLERGATEARVIPARHLRMGRTPPEQARQYHEGRPELLKTLLAQRQPVREVDVPRYRLELTEVTWQQLLNWLNSLWFARLRAEKIGPIEGRYLVNWKGEKLLDGDLDGSPCGIEPDGLFFFKLKPGCNGMLPAEGVFPRAALAYCESIGRHLVTEEQWESAAQPLDGGDFPWGSKPPDCKSQVFDQIASVPGLAAECLREVPRLADVREPTGDVSKDGVKHLFGNVSEITATRYATPEDPETQQQVFYVFRGTNIGSIREQGYTSYRSRMRADTARVRTGFRCAE